jgi:cytochrome c oxidase subunit 3
MSDSSALAHQFDDLRQQREAATLGMWVFLATEIMLFGGLFTAYTAYRWLHHPGWVEGGRHMDLVIGAVNTGVLIVSSLAMAQAVQSAERGLRRRLVVCLAVTALLGLVFLGLKGYEYAGHAHEGLVPGPRWTFAGPHSDTVQMFFCFYYAMTGLHAVHLAIGVTLVAALIVRSARGAFGPAYATPVATIGLYWHLIDVIWVFLFPLFYLVT